MRPQLHSPPMSPRRLIASCLAVLATGTAMLGCGSSDPVQVDIPSATVAAINSKLDQIQARFAAGDCTGSNSAESSLESLRAAVNGLDVDRQFIDDMNEMLDNLGKQIDAQCREPDKTTTTTSTTDTLPTTTQTTTDTVPTTTETTTKETTQTTTTTDTTTTQPQTSTTTPGGGVSPGGRNGKKAPKGNRNGKPRPGGGVRAPGGAKNDEDSNR
jgi:thioester reductase-like protein